ncbi:hypothetical protein [Conexibacter sp. DBS9H8]|uniref:hypothetical protein n=1 Tax=Conexibacter sp. DBS9H8 TaxID=2937801 RepID=UPI00201071A3|nr:hypothetical protein [Conexibacter sp. DBS9H8]
MPSYLFSFRAPTDYEPGGVSTAEWGGYFQGISSHLEDLGNPIFSRETVGVTGAGTKLSGYSVITAETTEQAIELASACPLIQIGGGIEVGEITPVSPETMQASSSAKSAIG